MNMCRRFKGDPVTRLIVSVPDAVVRKIDGLLLRPDHPARGCMSEFLRLAIAEKLERDLMLSRTPPKASHQFRAGTRAKPAEVHAVNAAQARARTGAGE